MLDKIMIVIDNTKQTQECALLGLFHVDAYFLPDRNKYVIGFCADWLTFRSAMDL